MVLPEIRAYDDLVYGSDDGNLEVSALGGSLVSEIGA